MTDTTTFQLMTATEITDGAPLIASRFGGLPAVPDGFQWPLCAEHGEPMQFTAQLADGDDLILVFFCQANPGMCDSWDPDSGCNAGIVVPSTGLHLAEAPESESGTAVFDEGAWLLQVQPGDHTDWPAAADEGRSAGHVVAGQLGGEPLWIQGDETPDAHRFVAMLMEMPFGFNFGGGWAYVFADDAGHAKVLWQQ